MKALTLILLAAVYAAAQNPTVADVARQERARRAQSRSAKVYTTEDIRTTPPPTQDQAAAADASLATKAAPTTPETPGTEPVPAAAPIQDPVQQWLAETEKLREQLRDLLDQEAVAQLEINNLTNQINAPITTQSAKDQAATNLQFAQEKLAAIRERIAKSRNELQARESQGPPKK